MTKGKGSKNVEFSTFVWLGGLGWGQNKKNMPLKSILNQLFLPFLGGRDQALSPELESDFFVTSFRI